MASVSVAVQHESKFTGICRPMVALVRSCQSSHAYTGDKLYSVLCSKDFFTTSTCCYGRMTMVSDRTNQV